MDFFRAGGDLVSLADSLNHFCDLVCLGCLTFVSMSYTVAMFTLFTSRI